MPRKASPKEINGDPKLWFKPYCKKCQLIFDDYNEFIEHCAEKHWNEVERL